MSCLGLDGLQDAVLLCRGVAWGIVGVVMLWQCRKPSLFCMARPYTKPVSHSVVLVLD